MAKKKKDLTPAKVYARIRPFDASGKSGHSADGDAAKQTIEKFDETSVTIDDTGRRQKDEFKLTGVIQPDADQESAFNSAMIQSGLIEGFHTDTNVLFYAYGQTGSGKTHTMLGETASLKEAVPNDGWGLFPRVVHKTLQVMNEKKAEGAHSILTVAAVEFYCLGAFDLNTKPKGPVTITAEAQAFGATETRLTSASDLAEYLPRVFGNRYTAKTKMNDASSRSHCALILTLHQVDKDDKYMRTTFSMIDLAGSERNDKTGAGERVNGNEAFAQAATLFKEGTAGKLPLAAQGFMINYELSFVQTEILKAGDMHRKGLAYKAQKAMSTAGTLYMTACCDGRAALGMIVTLSPSPQHGFESWFTLKVSSPFATSDPSHPIIPLVPLIPLIPLIPLKYAGALVELKAPLTKQKSADLSKAIKDTGVKAVKAQEDFAKSPQNPTRPNQVQNYMAKLGLMNASAELLVVLEELAKAKADALKGLKSKRSGWDIVRRKKTPEQRAAKLVRIASKWNAKFDAKKVDMAKVAQSLESISKQINDSLVVGVGMSDAVVSGAADAAKLAAEAVGKATAKVGPQPQIKLADQFSELDEMPTGY